MTFNISNKHPTVILAGSSAHALWITRQPPVVEPNFSTPSFRSRKHHNTSFVLRASRACDSEKLDVEIPRLDVLWPT